MCSSDASLALQLHQSTQSRAFPQSLPLLAFSWAPQALAQGRNNPNSLAPPLPPRSVSSSGQGGGSREPSAPSPSGPLVCPGARGNGVGSGLPFCAVASPSKPQHVFPPGGGRVRGDVNISSVDVVPTAGNASSSDSYTTGNGTTMVTASAGESPRRPNCAVRESSDQFLFQ
jgi:hypothetical protein